MPRSSDTLHGLVLGGINKYHPPFENALAAFYERAETLTLIRVRPHLVYPPS
jgi:hypothetical protein